MENKIIDNQNQIINEKDYEIYVSNQSKPGFDDLHYFNWCQQIAFKYWQPMQQCKQCNEWNGYQKNGRKWQDFFCDNGNGITLDGSNNMDLSIQIPQTLCDINVFKQFYWSVCENMRLFADDVSYALLHSGIAGQQRIKLLHLLGESFNHEVLRDVCVSIVEPVTLS